MINSANPIYSSKIIKAGALLADTKTLLANWDKALTVSENLDRVRRDNIFGKASRSRVEDILAIFRQRYLTDEQVTEALVILTKRQFSGQALDLVLYFYSAQADLLLHDIVTQLLSRLQAQGRTNVTVQDIEAALSHWVEEGKMVSHWSQGTISRVAQGLLATLRDFGVLQGAVKKRLTPIYLPVEAFAFLAFQLSRTQPSGNKLVHHPEWQLFFLIPEAVERFFIAAHQEGLLQYHAAGSTVRIDFPAQSIEEYAHALTQRSR
ncbi:MAG: BrxA family protein [Thermoplasmata archaeon]